MQNMNKKGFTIVELAIVIVVIAILAAISIGAYGAWRKETAKSEVTSELQSAATAMKNYRTFNGGYATALPDSYKKGGNVTVTLKYVTGTDFCAEGVSSTDASVLYSIKGSTGEPSSGACGSPPATTGGTATTPGGTTTGGCASNGSGTVPSVCIPKQQEY